MYWYGITESRFNTCRVTHKSGNIVTAFEVYKFVYMLGAI